MKRTLAITPLFLLSLLIGTSSGWANSLTRGESESAEPNRPPTTKPEKRSPAVGDAESRVRSKHQPDMVADVGDIYDACNGNQLGATRRFQNKVIEVTGIIRSISLTPPRLDLEERDRWFGGVVICDFGGDSDRALAKMADGETVTARGLFKSCAATTLVGCVVRHDTDHRASGY